MPRTFPFLYGTRGHDGHRAEDLVVDVPFVRGEHGGREKSCEGNEDDAGQPSGGLWGFRASEVDTKAALAGPR